MRVYFDTSALVPAIVSEPGTARCNRLWNRADGIISSTLSYVETHAAIAQAVRQGRLDDRERRHALRAFELRWSDVIRVPPNEQIVHHAATLTSLHRLRGYDAVHCATALAAFGEGGDEAFVAVSGDRDLLQAWSELGIATIDTDARPPRHPG